MALIDWQVISRCAVHKFHHTVSPSQTTEQVWRLNLTNQITHAVWLVLVLLCEVFPCSLCAIWKSALTPLQSDVRFVLLRFDWRLSHFRVRSFGWVTPSTAAGVTLLFSSLLLTPVLSLLFISPLLLSGEVISPFYVIVTLWPNHFRLWKIFHKAKCYFSILGLQT